MAEESRIQQLQQILSKNMVELNLTGKDLDADDDEVSFLGEDDISEDSVDVSGDDDSDVPGEEEDIEVYLSGINQEQLRSLDAEDLSLLTSMMCEDVLTSEPPDNNQHGEDNSLEQQLMPAESTSLEPDHGGELSKPLVDKHLIFRQIREEIDRRVREEMKEDLIDYSEYVKATKGDHVTGSICSNLSEEADNLEEMEPKLRAAILKMQKLDKILEQKILVEKEAKKSRMLLERRIRKEIAELSSGVNIPRDIRINTEKFLALEPPASHNEGIILEEGDDVLPVFQTELQDRGSNSLEDGGNGRNYSGSNHHESPDTDSVSAKLDRGSQPHKKNFIQRNKELAANADQWLPMTDDEKQRLVELLDGVDNLQDPPEENCQAESNREQLVLQPGEGFHPDQAEMESLSTIDERLRALAPEEDFVFQSIASPRSTPQTLFSRVGLHVSHSDQPEKFGERILNDFKDERELNARLQSIEQELDKFKAQSEFESGEFHLSEQALDSLLDQCARSVAISSSRETPDLSARSLASVRQALIKDPPRLTEEQLQKLLSEAHFPLSSRLTCNWEDDAKMAAEEGSCPVIQAETWRAIQEVDLLQDELLGCDQDWRVDDLEQLSQDLEPSAHLSEEAGLNTSNNHNHTTTPIDHNANLQPGNQHGSSNLLPDGEESLTLSAFDPVYPAILLSSSHSLHSNGLPKISFTNGVKRSEHKNESRSNSSTPVVSAKEGTNEAVKLPSLSVKSFLVHAPQGATNCTEKSNLLRPPPPPGVATSHSHGQTTNVINMKSGHITHQPDPHRMGQR